MAKKFLDMQSVGNPVLLYALINALVTEVGQLRTLVNELRTDHATFKTAVDSTKTAVDELIDDHATFKTALETTKTAVKNACLSDVGIAIGSTATKIKTTATAVYLITGQFYSKGATDDFWTLTGFDCPNGQYNKCLLCIDSSGNMQIAAGTAGASAVAVVLPTIPASYAVVGMVQVNPTGTGDFTGGTTDLNDGTVVPNAVYTNYGFHPGTIGDAPATLTASKPTAGPATLTAAAVVQQVEGGR